MKITSNGKNASNKTCKGLNKLSIDTKNTHFGLKMKKLWPLEDDLIELTRKEKENKTPKN